MKQPNNLRNRYRRYRAARQAYNFCWLSFRQWAGGWGKDDRSYYAIPGQPDENVKLVRA